MTHDIQGVQEFFKSSFPYFFIILSLTISMLLLTSDDFVKTLYKKKENKNIVMVSDDFQEDNPKFSTRYFHQDPSVQDVLYEIMELAKVFLILPAVVATTLLISNLENFLPALNSGIIELLAVLVFIYFNTNYWILLAYLIQSFHDLCTEDQPVPKTFLSIIPQ